MPTLTPKRWQFTAAEMEWLSNQAVTNQFAADILVKYNKRYGRRSWRFRRGLYL